MPVNYELITNEIEYQGLADLSVLVEDTSSNSPDYFRVSNLPTEFTAGKNTFHFKGNPLIFQEGSSVYIEVLDSNGKALYYETALDLESEDQTAIVTVYVNESTPSGTAYIILCSTISNDINGNFLDTSQINLRWTAPVYIDISKRNDSEIIFDVLPEITVTASTGSYTNLIYPGGSRFKSSTLGNLIYYNNNNTAVIVTASNATIGFDTGSISGTVSINSNVLNNGYSGTITEHYSSSFTVSDAGIIVLDNPISLEVQDSISRFEPETADITSANIVYEMSASGAQTTQNSNNLATVVFSNLQPQVGEVAKIRSYYRSAGIGEYILSNETDISDQATEFGFNADAVTTSFFLPTIHRNDKLDFKFEFINPIGLASKQVIESLDNSFPGGNTYIGGDDNLLTGSLYVAGATGTGVHISGKGSSAMIRSIGYTGFQNAIGVGGKGGFVMYSGSVQSILGSAESYSGVGLELVANSSSYFKYATSGTGLLDVRTNSFFLGNVGGAFISGSGNNLQISSSNFFLGNIGGVFISGSGGNLQISASNFSILNGNVTASNMLLQNISYADFFANKQIVIDSSNQNQFYRYIVPSDFAQAYCVLDLSGVQGPFATGSAAMYVRFYVNPILPIAAIISPADSGYDGQIIIETYGPAYSTPTYIPTCGTGTNFGTNVLFKANYVTQNNLISSINNFFYTSASIQRRDAFYGGSPFTDYFWSGSGKVASTYFSDTTSITPPIGLTVNTLGKKRSYRSRITFETDDWASYSYNLSIANPAIMYQTCPDNYQSIMSCAPGGRYAFAPGDSGWRLQSVTNYGGSVTPWFANSLTVSKSFQAGALGSAWTGVSFETNWSNYGSGYQSVQYKKFGDQVYLRGLATSGVNSWTTYPTIFTLPEGYRPPNRLVFTQTGNIDTPIRVDINSNGTVQWFTGGAGSGYISLDGILFSTLS